MTPTKPYNIFNEQGCITPEALSMCIDKKFSPEENKLIRTHAKTCTLCSDSLEGAAMFSSSKQFNSRIANLHNSKFRRSFNSQRKTRSLYYGLGAAAASLILCFGLFFTMRLNKLVENEMPELALHEEFFVKHDSIQAPRVSIEQVVRKKEKPLNLNAKGSDKTAQQKPVRPLMPNDNIIIVEIEEEIIVEEIEFNGLEFDVELQTIPLGAAESDEETIVLNNSNSPNSDLGTETPQTRTSAQSDNNDVEDKVKNRKNRSKENKNKQNRNNNDAYYMAEVTPMFQGGNIDSFNSYLADNLKVIIPDSVLLESIIISFVIDTAGNISKVKLVSGTSSDELNKHILEFVKESPVWLPGYAAGSPVETYQESEIVLDSTYNTERQ